MSDVWRELEGRLKQKAKTFGQIDYERNLDLDKAVEKDLDPSQLCAINNKWMMSKWVGLEDVKEAIQRLKQDYVLVERQKLLLIKGILEKTAFKRNVEELWIIPKKSKPYDNSPEGHYPACIVPEFLIGKKLVMIMNEYYQELMKTLEELLKE